MTERGHADDVSRLRWLAPAAARASACRRTLRPVFADPAQGAAGPTTVRDGGTLGRGIMPGHWRDRAGRGPGQARPPPPGVGPDVDAGGPRPATIGPASSLPLDAHRPPSPRRPSPSPAGRLLRPR